MQGPEAEPAGRARGCGWKGCRDERIGSHKCACNITLYLWHRSRHLWVALCERDWTDSLTVVPKAPAGGARVCVPTRYRLAESACTVHASIVPFKCSRLRVEYRAPIFDQK